MMSKSLSAASVLSLTDDEEVFVSNVSEGFSERPCSPLFRC